MVEGANTCANLVELETMLKKRLPLSEASIQTRTSFRKYLPVDAHRLRVIPVLVFFMVLLTLFLLGKKRKNRKNPVGCC